MTKKLTLINKTGNILQPFATPASVRLRYMNEISYLLNKYNRPVPRYTSYPTVPYWYMFDDNSRWQRNFEQQFNICNNPEGISLYIHLPFCESLCTYCGCNKKITTNHGVEDEYITAVLQEWQLYCALAGGKPLIRELHLGGGTPTFFSPENLQRLVSGILAHATVHPEKEFSFEGHPNNTTKQHLQTLFGLGFTRVSYGVQDNDPVVQHAINRLQPLYNVQQATENARAVGFTSVNFDLIYGMPFQTLESIKKTCREIIALRPDRIAFYSYAHVPWKQKAQRLFDETNLPDADLKMQLYLLGKNTLASAGYYDIGMDHFALPHDDLYVQSQNGKLHRNFMGYTTTNTKMLIGLGVSAISDTGSAYAQNHKELENYYRCVNNNELAVTKGYFLEECEQAAKQSILETACKGYTMLAGKEYDTPYLKQLQDDGLVTITNNRLTVTGLGRQFVRNICRAFDLFASENENSSKKLFSNAV